MKNILIFYSWTDITFINQCWAFLYYFKNKGQNKMAGIFQNTFSNALYKKGYCFDVNCSEACFAWFNWQCFNIDSGVNAEQAATTLRSFHGPVH